MNRLIILFSFIELFSYGQKLDGRYNYYDETIEFFQDTLVFDIQSNGGLTNELKGQGLYTIVGEYIIVKTSTYNGLRSSYKKKCESGLKIEVFTPDTLLRNQYSISFVDNNGSFQGKASAQTKQIKISALGDALIIPYSKCHLFVTLYGGYVLENTTVVFKIHSQGTKDLSLELITTNYKSKSFSLKMQRKKEKKLKKKYGEGYVKQFTKT